MNTNELKDLLTEYPDRELAFTLPGGSVVPAHFHVTEVGRVDKKFIDCGGTERESSVCLIQIWVANDMEHRVRAHKLKTILKLAEAVIGVENLPVEIEYEDKVISQYPLTDIGLGFGSLVFSLTTKHTDCLAPDKCGIKKCCESGCC